jgi:hypothetical protein
MVLRLLGLPVMTILPLTRRNTSTGMLAAPNSLLTIGQKRIYGSLTPS